MIFLKPPRAITYSCIIPVPTTSKIYQRLESILPCIWEGENRALQLFTSIVADKPKLTQSHCLRLHSQLHAEQKRDQWPPLKTFKTIHLEPQGGPGRQPENTQGREPSFCHGIQLLSRLKRWSSEYSDRMQTHTGQGPREGASLLSMPWLLPAGRPGYAIVTVLPTLMENGRHVREQPEVWPDTNVKIST